MYPFIESLCLQFCWCPLSCGVSVLYNQFVCWLCFLCCLPTSFINHNVSSSFVHERFFHVFPCASLFWLVFVVTDCESVDTALYLWAVLDPVFMLGIQPQVLVMTAASKYKMYNSDVKIQSTNNGEAIHSDLSYLCNYHKYIPMSIM